MRLIHTQTKRLHEFSSNIPRYAILSHTWGESEVSFRDIQESGLGYTSRAGWTKIDGACAQALKEELNYIWIDTCCINKESSAELQEAINSMFQYYQQAAVCFAYLSDVEKASSSEETLEKLSQSRWFKRGWTLQELVAPDIVEFYLKDWSYLGTREEHKDLIHSCSGINIGILSRQWPLNSYSIGARLSWASQRETTRIEDKAYSLLGILGVHMPLLYGEGNNAFQRLLAEVIKVSVDETIFAHTGCNILADGPEDYTGGWDLASLPSHSELKTYQLTNNGLHIHMKTFTDKSDQSFGVLNCHISQDLERYIAISLKRNQNAMSFSRIKGEHQFVEEDFVDSLPASEIMIQLQPPQIPQITCLLKRTPVYRCERLDSNAHMSKRGEFDRIDMTVDPKTESKFIILSFFFRSLLFDQQFIVQAVFDLEDEKAGVLIQPPSITMDCNEEVIADIWGWDGRPSSAVMELQSSAHRNASSVARVTVSIKAQLKLRRKVWVLEVADEQEAPDHS